MHDPKPVADTTPEPSPFGVAWRVFVEQNPQVETLPADQRAMLRRGFVYGWRARKVAEAVAHAGR